MWGVFYIYDDVGMKGGFSDDLYFVIVGDFNVDLFDGDLINDVIL